MKISFNNGYSALAASMSSKTPQKNGGALGGLTGKKSKTPTTKTPLAGGDRFIPHRGNSNFELGHYLVNKIFIFKNNVVIIVFK